jgi:hypothetical protein
MRTESPRFVARSGERIARPRCRGTRLTAARPRVQFPASRRKTLFGEHSEPRCGNVPLTRTPNTTRGTRMLPRRFGAVNISETSYENRSTRSHGNPDKSFSDEQREKEQKMATNESRSYRGKFCNRTASGIGRAATLASCE